MRPVEAAVGVTGVRNMPRDPYDVGIQLADRLVGD
jgi:hypothetical protein